MSREESAERTKEIVQQAVEAGADTEEKLLRMRFIKAVEIPRLEQEYVELREDLVESLDGPRAFLDAEGHKLIGHVVRPDKTIVNDELLDELDPEVVEFIAPRKIDRKRLTQAMAGDRLTNSQKARALTVIPGGGTPHVRFIDTEHQGDED